MSSPNVSLNDGKWTARDTVADEDTKVDFKEVIGDHQSHKARFGTIFILVVPT